MAILGQGLGKAGEKGDFALLRVFPVEKIVFCEARFVVCGSHLCVWFEVLQFLANPGTLGSGAGAGRGRGEGLPGRSCLPQTPSLGMALERGIWTALSFLSPC